MNTVTTDFYSHLKNLFIIEHTIEIIILASIIKIYYYFFVTSPAIDILKIILGLIAPVILIVIFVRNSVINFKSIVLSIPDEKVDAEIVTLLIKLMGYLNAREAAGIKIMENIERLGCYELMSIKSRLVFKYMRYCYFTNNDKFIKSAKYIAETTAEKKYLDFIESNTIT